MTGSRSSNLNQVQRGSASSTYRSASIVGAHWALLAVGVGWLFPGCWSTPEPAVLAISALSALAVALVVAAEPKSTGTRWMAWAILLLAIVGWASAGTARADAQPLLSALAQLGLACALSAAGTQLGSSGSVTSTPRASARRWLGAVSGGLGLVLVTLVARRGPPGAVYPSLLVIPTLLVLFSNAGRLEHAVALGSSDDVMRVTQRILATLWLGIAALAAASLAAGGSALCAMDPSDGQRAEAWTAAVLGARLGWLNVLPMTGMALVILWGRLELAGRAMLAPRTPWFSFALLSVAGVASGVYGLNTTGRRLAGEENPQTEAPARALGEARGPAALAPSPALPPADPSSPLAPSASAGAREEARGAREPVRITEVVATGVLETDVRSAIEQRFQALNDCRAQLDMERSGQLTLKAVLSAGGGVASVNPTAGELEDTALAQCMMLALYRTGFAAPGPNGASFIVTFAISTR